MPVANPHAGARSHDLLRDDGLIISDGSHDEGQTMGERLADGIVPGMTNHRLNARQEPELWDTLTYDEVRRRVGKERWMRGKDDLHVELTQRSGRRRVEISACGGA